MARSETLSRRDFLYVAGASVGAYFGTKTVVDLSIKSPHYLHYLRYRNENLPGNVNNDIEPYVYITHDNTSLNIENEGVRYLVNPNRNAFSEALINIAKKEKSDRGLQKLERFIKTSPLEIRMQESVKKYILEDGKEHEALSTYTPSMIDGPTVRFSRSYLEATNRARISGNLKHQIHYDQAVWHELYHFWQDSRNPYKHGANTLYCSYLNGRDEERWLEKCEHKKNPIEIEAEKKSYEIVDSLRAGYLTSMVESWPFGKFFTFTKV